MMSNYSPEGSEFGHFGGMGTGVGDKITVEINSSIISGLSL